MALAPRHFTLPYEIPTVWSAQTAYKIQKDFEAVLSALQRAGITPDGGGGVPGADGTPGIRGLMGPPGLDAEPAEDGMTVVGPVGRTGLTGAAGLSILGPPGPPGFDGADAEDVWPGLPGPPGTTGLAGGGATGETLYTNARHPQGVVAASVGSICRDTTSGYLYVKLGGGGTVWGWYRLGLTGAGIRAGLLTWYVTQQAGGTNFFVGSSGVGPFSGDTTATFVGTGVASTVQTVLNGRVYGDGTSSAVINSSMYVTTPTSGAWKCLDDDLDLLVEMATAASLANLRIWFGISSAGLTDTATLGSASNGSLMFRYSTTEADPGWVGVSQLNGAGNQTVSALVAAIAAATEYRLRIRFVRSGTPTAYFSVNDGAEIAITTNIPTTGNTYFGVFGLTTKDAVLKRLLWRSFGASVGA